jgi:predicted permease
MRRFPAVLPPSREFGTNLVIVALLSFGLGTATLLYTAMDRLLVHPLPGIHAETLVGAAVKRPQVVTRTFPLTTYDAAQKMRSVSGVLAESDFDTSLTGGAPRRIVAGMVSDNYFSVLGVPAALGRVFGEGDARSDAGTVPVVLSHRLWMRGFGGSGAAIGKTLSLAGRSFTIVGVMPEHFYGTALDSSPELWLPFSAQPLLSRTSLRAAEPDKMFNLVARLRGGVSLAQAHAEFAAMYAAQEAAAKDGNPGQGILEPVASGAFYLHDQFARALTLLAWGVAVFLVILCANVAGLLLVRAARRERSTAIRVALGASRSHLVGRVLVEGMALGLAGAAGGLAAAWAFAPAMSRLLPYGYTPLPVSLEPDWNTGIAATGIALAVSVGFSLAPAWLAARVAPQESLRTGGSTRRAGASGRVLLSIQTGLTLVLLVASGLLVRTFLALRSDNPGFETGHIVTFTLDPSMAGTSATPSPQLAMQLERRVRALPGVRDAGFATAEPMHRVGYKTSVAAAGRRIAQADFLNTSMNQVSPSFFDTLGIPILHGQVFTAADELRTNPLAVVVNQEFARAFFPGEDPLGKTFGHGIPGQMVTPEFIVVGVAADAKYRSLREAPPPTYYAPIEKPEDWGSTLFLYVRTQGAPNSVIGAVRNVLAALDSRLPFFDVITMPQQISESLWQERILAALASILSGCAILMAAAGLYGLLAFDTTQRMREFGIRAALGAGTRDIAALLRQDIARIIVPGIAGGLVACMLLARMIASVLYGVNAIDPVSLAGACGVILLVCTVAGWNPIRRAIQVDPATVLRDE